MEFYNLKARECDLRFAWDAASHAFLTRRREEAGAAYRRCVREFNDKLEKEAKRRARKLEESAKPWGEMTAKEQATDMAYMASYAILQAEIGGAWQFAIARRFLGAVTTFFGWLKGAASGARALKIEFTPGTIKGAADGEALKIGVEEVARRIHGKADKALKDAVSGKTSPFEQPDIIGLVGFLFAESQQLLEELGVKNGTPSRKLKWYAWRWMLSHLYERALGKRAVRHKFDALLKEDSPWINLAVALFVIWGGNPNL